MALVSETALFVVLSSETALSVVLVSETALLVALCLGLPSQRFPVQIHIQISREHKTNRKLVSNQNMKR